MAKRNQNSLGKGIDALFGDNLSLPEEHVGDVTLMRLSLIEPNPLQPRKNISEQELYELAESIKSYGMIQPIVVRPQNNGYYQIIAGERRWRAAKIAELTEVPVIVREAGEKETAELALVENLMRSDLDPIEEAMGYRALMDRFGLSQDAVSEAVGKPRSTVANSLRLLTLEDEVIEFIREGKLTTGHAKALAGVKDKKRQVSIAKTVVARDLSVRQTELLASQREHTEKQPTDHVNYVKILERRATRASGRTVKIKQGKKSGKLEISYTDNNDLEDILKKLCGKMFFEDNL